MFEVRCPGAVKFYFPDDALVRHHATAPAAGESAPAFPVDDLGTLHFDYQVVPDERFPRVPKVVFDNGRQTCIWLPAEAFHSDLAVLYELNAYPGLDAPTLDGLSLEVPAGQSLAIVGENGAGKTFLVKLLARMYEPAKGRILVDGWIWRRSTWRRGAPVSPPPSRHFARFELPAQHAVGIGDLARLDDRAAVVDALERAGAADVLGKLPVGTRTQLGGRWRGVDLSTGQWQKLALGRALMRRDSLVVFFDEPTASLDALAEHALFERYTREARSGSGAAP